MTRDPLPREAVVRRQAQRWLSPYQVIALSFAGAILAGTVLLALPIAHAPGSSPTLLDALFTATSAVCVTGLAVVDTAATWSAFGELVILLLIQVGGLGIITLGTVLAFVLGRRLSLRERMRLQTEMHSLQMGGVVRLLRRLLVFTLACELLGALLLLLRFSELYPLGQAAYLAVFHSVSAFNNAGFALFPGSVTGFADDPLVLLTLAGLLILGGFSFVAVANLMVHAALGRRAPLTLSTRVMTLMTVLLLLGGTVLLLLFEWSNEQTLGGQPFAQRLLSAFFQSATARTAGFNSLDYAQLREVSLVLTIMLMFIGANPASTGGGIKTTTVYVLLGSAWSQVRGRGELVAFGRRIASDTVVRAGSIALLSLLLVTTGIGVLSLTDPEEPFLALAFEAFSAFGTVGLSTGVTPLLSVPAKLVLIALMYLGRIGPLVAALALAERRRASPFGYPEGEVVIG